ncbi:MAG: cytochrome c [Acidobacteriales bacterium]|nr:cytochrome c [Terriglobales bacterium]
MRRIILLVLLLSLAACTAERRKSDAELNLTPQQTAGRHLYDTYCDRCHAPYSSGGRQGPSLQHVFGKSYLPVSGLPANNDRVSEIIRTGRAKMPAYGNILSDQDIQDLLAYLHTL